MKTIIRRFRAETPAFFKRVRNLALSITAASSASALFYEHLPATFAANASPSLINTIAWVGGVAAFVAQLAKADTPKEA